MAKKVFAIVSILLCSTTLALPQSANIYKPIADSIVNKDINPFFVFITHTKGCVGCCASSINYLSDQIANHYPDSKINLIIYSPLKGEGIAKRKLFNNRITNVVEAFIDSSMASKKMPVLLMSYKNLDFLFEDLQSGMITVDSIKTIINEISSKISIESIQPISEDSIIISNIISPTMASNGIIYGIDDEINSIFKISNESFLLIDIPKDSILASKLYDNTNPDDINVWGNLLKYYPSLISYRNIIKIKDTIIILANSIGGYTKHEGAPPRYDAIKSFYLFKINKNDFDVIKFPIDKILYGAIRKNPISQKYYISQYFQNSRYSQKKDSIYAIMELDFQNNFFSDHCNYKNIINKKRDTLFPLKRNFILCNGDSILFIDFSNKLFTSIFSNKLNYIYDSTHIIFKKSYKFIDFVLYNNNALSIYLDIDNDKYKMIFDKYNFRGELVSSQEIKMPFTEKILYLHPVETEQNKKLFFLIKLEKSRWNLMKLE